MMFRERIDYNFIIEHNNFYISLQHFLLQMIGEERCVEETISHMSIFG
jgi:hypothetical protein